MCGAATDTCSNSRGLGRWIGSTMHFTEGKRARDKECDKESDAADDAAKTKDGFGRKVHSFGVVEVWCWSRSSERLLIVDDTQIGRGGGGACTTFHDGN